MRAPNLLNYIVVQQVCACTHAQRGQVRGGNAVGLFDMGRKTMPRVSRTNAKDACSYREGPSLSHSLLLSLVSQRLMNTAIPFATSLVGANCQGNR